MGMSKAQTALAISAGFLIGMFFLTVVGVLAYLAGPRIEGFLFPIVKAEHIAGSVERDKDSLCWSTFVTKLHWGDPAYFQYWIERPAVLTDKNGKSTSVNVEIPTAPYRLINGERKYMARTGFLTNQDIGAKWETRFCIDVPHDISTNDYFTVLGEGFYDVPHHLWRVPVELPSFFVPGGIITDNNPRTNNKKDTPLPPKVLFPPEDRDDKPGLGGHPDRPGGPSGKIEGGSVGEGPSIIDPNYSGQTSPWISHSQASSEGQRPVGGSEPAPVKALPASGVGTEPLAPAVPGGHHGAAPARPVGPACGWHRRAPRTKAEWRRYTWCSHHRPVVVSRHGGTAHRKHRRHS